MTYQSGYSLLDSNNHEVQQWVGQSYGETAAIPNVIKLPNGDHVHCPAVNQSYSGFKLVEKFSNDDPPDPGLIAPTLVAAAFNITVSDGDISSIEGGFNLVAALYLGEGQYMLLFLKPMASDAYFGQLTGAPYIRITERETDYCLVEARTEPAGAFIDPAQFSVQIYSI